ncbi:MAG: N-acetylmuramoyl-L-alanine amidase [Pseudomonadota bacterium]
MILRALLFWTLSLLPAGAQDMRMLALVDRAGIVIHEGGGGRLDLTLPLSAPVPWRLFLQPDPWRFVLDTAEVDWSALDGWTPQSDVITGAAFGRVHPGWSRLVLDLDRPMIVTSAWLDTSGEGADLRISAGRGSAGAQMGPKVRQDWDVVRPALPAPQTRRQTGDGPLVVALDPGHGGIDPGAERGGVAEADLMLTFANELGDLLRRRGHQVVLTRETDTFLALRGRASVARAAGADLMISLHADAVQGGGASGATVYTLSDEASDQMSKELAARHGRDDLLLGLSLAESGDEIAQVLVDLARTETGPRANGLAAAMVQAINEAGLRLHKRPRLAAAFTVLKAPDIPSVLLELGFMSDERDLANLQQRAWRARMAQALVVAVERWAATDAAEAAKLRQ